MDDTVDISIIENDNNKENDSQTEPQSNIELPNNNTIEEQSNESFNIFDQKTKLHIKIKLYREYFPDDLRDYRDVDISTLDVDQLRELLDSFDSVLNSISCYNYIREFAFPVIDLYEKMMIKYGINCKGLSEGLQKDKQFEKDLKHASLYYFDIVEMQPLQRLLFTVMKQTSIITKVNMLNNIQSNYNTELNEEQLSTINNNFTNL